MAASTSGSVSGVSGGPPNEAHGSVDDEVVDREREERAEVHGEEEAGAELEARAGAGPGRVRGPDMVEGGRWAVDGVI